MKRVVTCFVLVMCKARDIHLFPSLSPSPHFNLAPLTQPPPPLLLSPTFFFFVASHLIHVHGIGVVKEEESSTRQSQIQVERRVRPQKEQALNCPRCNSANTKFCYYNNYSLSQPRYFCKTCRRYWTEGGSLRNVPVGGGSRKNKRSSSSSSSISSSASSLASSTAASAAITAPASLASSSSASLQPSELIHPSSIPLASSKFYHGGHDLNLSFPNQSLCHELGGFPSSPSTSVVAAASTGVRSLSALELLRSGISARGLGPFAPQLMPPPGSIFGADFGFQELMRPSNMKMPLDGVGYSGSMQEGGGGRLLFPFEDLKQVPMSSGSHEAVDGMVQGQGDPTLFWNGIMGNDGGGTSNGGGGGGSW